MTKKQTREYKAANQERKATLMQLVQTAPPQSKHYWAKAFSPMVQDGKYTKK